MKAIAIILSPLLFIAGAAAQTTKPVMRANHLAIFVTDLKQSSTFYREVVGLDSIPEPFHDGKHVWLDLGFGTSLHIISGAQKKIQYFQNNHICLSTDNLDQFKTTLTQKKVTWYNAGGEKGKTTTRTDGVSQVWIQDPDGYWLEINNDKRTLSK
ncbi:MAG TPA: VOC family protein [Cyclobacteriaceae bacterium]|jgi:lactoylglutathione lyase|nr:VOC family protein [Cyclobacteriaceae bacterium]